MLGAPPRSLPVPSPSAGAWRSAQYNLRRALQEAELPPIRSPAALWALLHDSPWLPTTWGELCADWTMADVARPLLLARRQRPPGIFIWNIRYLRSTLSHKNQIKMAILTKVTSQRAALLQETHWSAHDAGTWDAQFSGRRVLAAPAFQGPGGGLCGGVAIILPHDWEVLSHSILVPGCALQATVRTAGHTWRLVSVYLPPDRVRDRGGPEASQ